MKVGDLVEVALFDGQMAQGTITAIQALTSGNKLTIKIEPDKVLNVMESQCSPLKR